MAGPWGLNTEHLFDSAELISSEHSVREVSGVAAPGKNCSSRWVELQGEARRGVRAQGAGRQQLPHKTSGSHHAARSPCA